MHRNRKWVSGCQGLEEDGNRESLLSYMGFFFQVMEMFSIYCGDGYITVNVLKNNWMVSF